MDKGTAEKILELTEPYDYATLRKQWKRLCSEYHPDKSVASGMDSDSSNEVLKDFNEAFSTLKPFVQDGSIVTPNESKSTSTSSNQDTTQQQSDGKSGNNETFQATYDAAVLIAYNATTVKDYETAAELFGMIDNYKDAATLRRNCLREAEALRVSQARPTQTKSQTKTRPKSKSAQTQTTPKNRQSPKDQQYAEALFLYEQAISAEQYAEAALKFKALGDYRDAKAYYSFAAGRVDVLNAKATTRKNKPISKDSIALLIGLLVMIAIIVIVYVLVSH